MGTVRQSATEIERRLLREAHPQLRKTVVTKVALAVGAMFETQTPNLVPPPDNNAGLEVGLVGNSPD